MNINTFDFNLLRVFDAVMKEGSLTIAGTRLGLSQSAMSHAVNRLRQTFNDPLFVRTTRGMKPTPFAQKLAGPVAEAIHAVRNTLELDMPFDPASSDRVFNLLMTDIAELIFLPRLIPYLKEVAPRVQIISTQMERSRYRDALEQGSADLAIGQIPQTHKDFYQQYLFDEPLVCLTRKDHPAIGDKITMEQLMSTEQVAVSTPALVEAVVSKALGKRAVRRRIVLQTPHYAVVPTILAKTDMVAIVPVHVAITFARLAEFKTLPLPFKVPAIKVTQFWHQRSHHDHGHIWLRSVLADLFREPSKRRMD
ncbi:LysR family transcriptional regulator [Noviherbaspirillum malthae]|jgi:DNA-binding transcriptional LysR family regulator|uniref:LysR family transcriptional regulator n=1 Tax=Noviherbaspirillum malthae TaxID=1260987 RepID=UPI00188F09D2|nr:LysR family transcriptional regulator [Noviherbaspirillum malthae]